MEIATHIELSNGKPYVYMLIAAASIAVSGFFAKLCLTSSISLPITVFSRFSIPLVILLFFFVATGRISKITWKNSKSHIIRSIFLTASQALFFLSITKLSLSESMILYSTGPLFITLYDICSKNKISAITIISLLFGAIGVSLMLHIQDGYFNRFVLIGLVSGICLCISQILLHRCSKNENPLDIMFFVYLFTTVFSSFLLFADFSPTYDFQNLYTDNIVIFLVLVGLFSISNQFFRGKAYSLVKSPSFLSPIIYFSVFVSVALDITFFKYIPDIETISGGILTLIGSYLSIKNRIKNA